MGTKVILLGWMMMFAADVWPTYVNQRFGFKVDYPIRW